MNSSSFTIVCEKCESNFSSPVMDELLRGFWELYPKTLPTLKKALERQFAAAVESWMCANVRVSIETTVFPVHDANHPMFSFLMRRGNKTHVIGLAFEVAPELPWLLTTARNFDSPEEQTMYYHLKGGEQLKQNLQKAQGWLRRA